MATLAPPAQAGGTILYEIATPDVGLASAGVRQSGCAGIGCTSNGRSLSLRARRLGDTGEKEKLPLITIPAP